VISATSRVASYILRLRVFFFMYDNIVIRFIGEETKTLLDAGCGRGERMKKIMKQRKMFAIGTDVFRAYLGRAKQIYDQVVCCDIRFLPFKEKIFDTVLCTEVVEHLQKGEAVRVMADFERLAKSQVIIGTPVGFQQKMPMLMRELIDQAKKYDSLVGHLDDPRRKHLCGFEPHELDNLGYEVFGADGPQEMYIHLAFAPLLFLFAPFCYFIPKFAHQMICVKKIR